MPATEAEAAPPVRVGIVGVRPGEYDGVLAVLPQSEAFRFVAFSDEGLSGPAVEYKPCAYYGDYNMLLQDPAVELILVDGPVARRRDFAVRALNAGHHVVLAPPFCESAPDAERVMKTALRAERVATMDMPWRSDGGLRALRAALDAENVGPVCGLLASFELEAPEEADAGADGLLQKVGMGLLDQAHLLLTDDVKSVAAHLQRPAPGVADDAFLVYMPLRGGGWAIVQASRQARAGLPQWTAYTARATFTVRDGRAVVLAGGQERTNDAAQDCEGFWENVHAAIRHGAELACHPAGIVRAMKLHEAALASAELGEPVTV
ncbi:MAG: Gfo/Idh/MocA family protein [Planctomycetota bacterium]|jgi:predicted dehydrogenase